jgi:Domain of unknown function (DUF5615)
MPLRFYMDVHVPAAITEGLRRRGIDVLTSQEDGTRQSKDEQLLIRSTEIGRILVSQDEDLLNLTARWQSSGWDFAGLVFAPQEGGSIGRYVDDLELIAVCCTEQELRGVVQHLPLR